MDLENYHDRNQLQQLLTAIESIVGVARAAFPENVVVTLNCQSKCATGSINVNWSALSMLAEIGRDVLAPPTPAAEGG